MEGVNYLINLTWCQVKLAMTQFCKFRNADLRLRINKILKTRRLILKSFSAINLQSAFKSEITNPKSAIILFTVFIIQCLNQIEYNMVFLVQHGVNHFILRFLASS